MDLIRHSASRDLRADLIRGLALWWIYVDHIPGDILANYSLRNFAMCDATEVFVLLAGYGAGLAYGITMDRQGYIHAAADAVRRAWVLYIAHIFLFVLFTAQVAWSAVTLDRGIYLEETRLDVLADDPFKGLLEALLLRFQPSLLNILPLYVVLLLFLAGVLPLLRWPRLLFALSFLLYGAVRITGLNFWSWGGEGWYFDPFAWQFLFVIGALLAYAPRPLPAVKWPWDIAAGIILLAGLLDTQLLESSPRLVAALPDLVIRYVVMEDKTGLHPFRLLSIISLLWLVVRLVPMGASWLRSHVAAPLVLVGQNSLPVFCAGILFGFFARLGLEDQDGLSMQVAVNLLGAFGLVAVGAIAAWYRVKGRTRPHRPGGLPVIAGTDTG